jgi:Mn2+/Fe2+ NRAMP family transporter
MKKILQIALGIIAAVGGFVDIGELVFNTQAGAEFEYALLWTVPVGVLGITVFAEMTGRVATIAKRPVFGVVRERSGFTAGLLTLVASQLVNLLTLAAEIGGVAIVLQLLFDITGSLAALVALVGLVAAVLLLPFGAIERIFGYAGLGLVVYVFATLDLQPDWHAIGEGFVPHVEHSTLYFYFVVGVIGAALVPYEVYFYSSGAIEDGWGPSDLIVNKGNAILGFGLGGILSIALICVSAQVFAPVSVQPDSLGTAALGAEQAYGETGLLLALLGMLFAIGGAAIEVSMSGAYSLAQFAGWEWGKYQGIRVAPRFTLAWMGMFVAAVTILATGIDPVEITEYAVVFSVVALPLTYFPVLLVARDRTFMGEHTNGWLSNILGWAYFAVILVIALSAIPLLLATNGGSG